LYSQLALRLCLYVDHALNLRAALDGFFARRASPAFFRLFLSRLHGPVG
jgi:hypothetical protein